VARALLLNVDLGRPRLEQLKIHFSFSRGGGVFSRLVMEPLFLRTWDDAFTACIDVVLLASLTAFTFVELRKVVRILGGKPRQETRWKQLLNALIVVFGWIIAFGYAVQDHLRKQVVTQLESVMAYHIQDVPAEKNTIVAGLLNNAEWIITCNSWFRLLIADYHLILMLSFFAAFQAQPRLGVVIGTLESSFVDILHFLLVLMPTFMAFAVSGQFIFGRRIEEFSTLHGAVGICVKLLMEGEYDWVLLSEEFWWTSVLWTWSFMTLMVLLMLNMVLGIVLDVYTTLRRRSGQVETVLETVRKAWQRIRYSRQWMPNSVLFARVEELGAQFTREELLEKVPDMYDTQFESLVKDSQMQWHLEGSLDLLDWAGSIKLILAVQVSIERLLSRLPQLIQNQQNDQTADVREKLWYQDTGESGGWLQRLSRRMALQNHAMLSIQWQLQQLQWQCQVADSLFGHGGEFPLQQEQDSPCEAAPL